VGSSVRDEAKIVQAKYDSLKEWKYDPKGYFLIRINLETREIEAGYCRRNNEVELVVKGKHPEELYATIVMESKLNLVSLKEHAAYLGMELEKAYIALVAGLEYVQDKELRFPGMKKELRLTEEEELVLKKVSEGREKLEDIEKEVGVERNKLKMVLIKLFQLGLIDLAKTWDGALNDEVWTVTKKD